MAALGAVERDGVRSEDTDVAWLFGPGTGAAGGPGSAATTGSVSKTSSSGHGPGGLGGAQA
eukprot:7466210-Alexandrium_andersonii.AAC.1